MSLYNEPALIKAIAKIIGEPFGSSLEENEEALTVLASVVINRVKEAMKPTEGSRLVGRNGGEPMVRPKITPPKSMGTHYSRFTGIVNSQARGKCLYADKLVTLVNRPGTSKANETINQQDIKYGAKMSFCELYDMVNQFETNAFKRIAVMWCLLSDEDRDQFGGE
jgi:hypothetical protein